MQKQSEKKKVNEQWHISARPIIRQNIAVCVFVLLILLVGMIILALNRMERTALISVRSTQIQISQQLGDTKKLMESLATLPEFYEPSYGAIAKAVRLNRIKNFYQYMALGYVDSEMNMHSESKSEVSLASREYMQRLFATGEYQITDSFPSGLDGTTLNCTVAVPLKNQKGEITGALFAAIYYEEIQSALQEAAKENGTRLLLVGSNEQIMSSTSGLPYDKPVLDIFREAHIIGMTTDKIQESFLAGEGGAFWGLYQGNLFYTVFKKVDYAGWNLMSSANFSTVFRELIPGMIFIGLFFILITIVQTIMMQRDIDKQSKTIELLIHSVEDLEKKIYHEEHPEHRDFNEIIQLTNKGLTDSLTGMVTRSVFINQALARLKRLEPGKATALCFVDLDNLKHINDTYGHNGGDRAIKSIGYILREFEKRYEGIVGRYGGDEFIILMTNMENREMIISILDELVLRLRIDIGTEGEQILIQCSMGVCVYVPDKNLEQMISEADEALYFVKQNGKGYYKIYGDGKTHEE